MFQVLGEEKTTHVHNNDYLNTWPCPQLIIKIQSCSQFRESQHWYKVLNDNGNKRLWFPAGVNMVAWKRQHLNTQGPVRGRAFPVPAQGCTQVTGTNVKGFRFVKQRECKSHHDTKEQGTASVLRSVWSSEEDGNVSITVYIRSQIFSKQVINKTACCWLIASSHPHPTMSTELPREEYTL